jgi:hypothetical protein
MFFGTYSVCLLICFHYLGYQAAVATMIALFLILSVSSSLASFGSWRVSQKEMKPGRNGCCPSCDLIAFLKGLSGAFGHHHYSSKVGCCVVGLLGARVFVLGRELRPSLVCRLMVVACSSLIGQQAFPMSALALRGGSSGGHAPFPWLASFPPSAKRGRGQQFGACTEVVDAG